MRVKFGKLATKSEPRYHREEDPLSLRSLWTMHASGMLTTHLPTFSHTLKTFPLSLCTLLIPRSRKFWRMGGIRRTFET